MKSSSLAALAALLLPLAAFAADDDSLVEVFATGVGTTQDEAMKAANRAAVEQVVGTMVDAATLVENDELVEDKVLTYSAGLIAASTIVGTPKQADGLITVKVKATVKKTALKEKLVAAKLVSSDVDGTSLWAAAVSEEERLRDAEAMIRSVLGNRTACLVVKDVPGKSGVSPIDRDPKTQETFVNVRVWLDPLRYRQFVKEVAAKLGPMAEAKTSYQGRGDAHSQYFKPPSYDGRLLDTKNALVVVDDMRSRQATAFQFGKNEFAVIEEECGKRPVVRVSVTDASGDVVAVGTQPVLTFSQNLCVLARTDRRSGYPCAVVPFCGGHFDYDGQMIDAFGHDPWTDRVFRIPLGAFSVDELKQFAKLHVEVGYEVDGQFEPAPIQHEVLEPEASSPGLSGFSGVSNASGISGASDVSRPVQPKPTRQPVKIPADLKPIHAALSAMRNKPPNKGDIGKIASLWKSLKPESKDALRDEIASLVCAGYLAIGDTASFQKARGGIPDMNRFGAETQENCSACGGGGSVSERCTACGGSTRCPRCRGAGTIHAPRMQGMMGSSASMSCSVCGGSGRCRECSNGRRSVRCSNCNGSGRTISKDKSAEAYRTFLLDAIQACEKP